MRRIGASNFNQVTCRERPPHRGGFRRSASSCALASRLVGYPNHWRDSDRYIGGQNKQNVALIAGHGSVLAAGGSHPALRLSPGRVAQKVSYSGSPLVYASMSSAGTVPIR